MTEAIRDFRTHRKYLRSFATMCGHIDGKSHEEVWADIAARVKASPTYAIAPKAPPKVDQLGRSLASSWGTEYLLATSHHFAREDDLVRLTNSWAVVQTYYVHYHAIQALLASRGRDRPSNHATTQNLFADIWTGPNVTLPPCSFGVGNAGAVNVPAGVVIDPGIHPWSASTADSCWSLAALALTTTRGTDVTTRKRANRERKQREARQEWQREEDARLAVGKKARKQPAFSLPRLSPQEHARIDRSIRNYTIMDYLYRLRVKANYIDAAMFTDGPEDEHVSRRLLQDLKDLAANTLLVHELHIGQLIGKKPFLGILDAWLKDREGPELGIRERRDLLANA